MTVHSRRASGAVLDRLEASPRAGTPVLHWFPGSVRDLDRAVRLGCWFSVGPAMLTGERGPALVARMPRERVLTESDGPFARIDGAPALPWHVNDAVHELGRIWSLPDDRTGQMLLSNLRQLIGGSDSL
jgi:TatD DNase family protein